jgi:hypothetical protein
MCNKYLISIILSFVSINVFSQKNHINEDNIIDVQLGVEYRITPFDKITPYIDPNYDVIFSTNAQLTGPKANYSIEFNVSEHNKLGFTHSLSYGHLYFDRNDQITNYSTVITYKNVNRLKHDFHFYYKRIIKINDVDRLNVAIGYSLMNRNTKYLASYVIRKPDGTISAVIGSTRNFTFGALRTELNAIVDKFNLGIIFYIADTNHPYASYNSHEKPFVMPALKISYSLFTE